jgi:hypothetical protein
MHKTASVSTIVFVLLTAFFTNASALTDGYILYGAYASKNTVLIDKDGKAVKKWTTTSLNGYSCYLLPNGNLLWSGQATGMAPQNAQPKNGIISEIDSTNKTVWTYTLCNDTMVLHHDMKPMPNGHILAMSFHFVLKAAAVSAGIDSSLMTGTGSSKGAMCEKIVEIDPTAAKGKEIVWEWRLLDHIVPKDQAVSHPEKISGGAVTSLWVGQWMHCNGIDYNPDKDLIVFSSRLLSECYVIDHSTTTQEAKGSTGGKYAKGGDLLYRWGNPANYGASGAYTIDCLHSTTWIPKGYPGAGDIMFFHNNQQGPTKNEQSQIIQIKPPLDDKGNFVRESGKPFGPTQPTWKYAPSSDFYSRFMSSAMRMPSGNTIGHETYPSKNIPPDGTQLNTNSIIREVDSAGTIVWKYTVAEGNVSKIMYYPSSYAGVQRLLHLPVGAQNRKGPEKSPASNIRISQIAGRVDFSNVAGCEIGLFNLHGKKVHAINPKTDSYALENGLVPNGLYCVKVTSRNRSVAFRTINIFQ